MTLAKMKCRDAGRGFSENGVFSMNFRHYIRVLNQWPRGTDLWRNHGELAEGWYDPKTKQRIDEAFAFHNEDRVAKPSNVRPPSKDRDDRRGSDDNDDYGPLPAPAGAQIPLTDDLAIRDEMAADDVSLQRKAQHEALKVDREAQRERLEELLPRAEAGTKERALEKKREAGAAAKAYRESAGGPGEMEEVGEGDMMGTEDEIKAMKKQQERQKNERELRREEILRARAEEREQRVRGLREKEETTMERLKAMAKERFG